MKPSDVLRLDRISLRNFRCFADCTVDLHPKLTVLVAENGRGKTAILDAIAIALGLFVDTVSGVQQSSGFSRQDIRLVRERSTGRMIPVLPTEFAAEGTVNGVDTKWRRTRMGISSRHRTSTNEAERFRRLAQELGDNVLAYEESISDDLLGPAVLAKLAQGLDIEDEGHDQLGEDLLGSEVLAKLAEGLEIEDEGQDQSDGLGLGQDGSPPTLPLVAYYGAGRVWNERMVREAQRSSTRPRSDRMFGYLGCLSSSSSVRDIADWYETMANKSRDPRFSIELFQNVKLLEAVREATWVVLEPTGWCMLDWDFGQKQLVVEHRDGSRLPLSALSDGVRNMVALVADITRRCASLNPHLGAQAARQTPGILLIDEVDAHLHPDWQQQIVGLLSEVFPAIQIVLSTHSPHVLSTVDKDSIRMIRFDDGEGWLEIPQFQTRGVESADILARIMGVDPIPHVEEARWLSDYRALVQTGQHETNEGRQLWDRILKHFSKNHPVVDEVETLRRLQEFKRHHQLPGDKDL